MATKYLKPQEPLHKVDKETGDIYYYYPLVTVDQIVMEDGRRMNAVFAELAQSAVEQSVPITEEDIDDICSDSV